MTQTIRIKMAGKEVELELSENLLTQSTIKSQFLLPPDATVSLSYEVAGRPIGCKTLSTPEPCFLLPDDWPDKQFTAESNVHQISPYYPASPPKPAPTSEAFIKWMFFLQDEVGKATTICIHPRFFVTFRHGTHAQYKIEQKLTIYKAEMDEPTGVEVSVVNINEDLDFVLLKSKSDVVDRGPPIVEARESEPFTLAGFGNEQQSLSYLPGAIHSIHYCYFNQRSLNMGPFILGTSRSSRGDSVGGVWSSRGLIGMNIGCTKMPQKVHNSTISGAATFSAKNIISPALRFEEAYMKELPKERERKEVMSPPPKKYHYETQIDGIGTLYQTST